MSADSLDKFIDALRGTLLVAADESSVDVVEARLRAIFAADRRATAEALEGCIGALAITVTNAGDSGPHWCQRQNGHDATCGGMLAAIGNARAALARLRESVPA